MKKVYAVYDVKLYSNNISPDICKVIRGCKIRIVVRNQNLQIYVYGDDRELTINCFYNVESLMFIIFGAFPSMKYFSIDGTKQKISNRNEKYFSQEYYQRRGIILYNLDDSMLNEEVFRNLDQINPLIIGTMEALVCKAYKHVESNHKTVLLMQSLSGLINENEFIDFNNSHSVDSQKMQGDYSRSMYLLLIDTFFKYDEKYQCGILTLLQLSKEEFLHVIADTRNWYSHYLSLDKKHKKITEGRYFIIYFEILYYSARIYILHKLLLKENEVMVKEYFYCLHDWINDILQANEPMKSSIYKLRFRLKQALKKPELSIKRNMTE